jgi:predicted transcriptional regulator
MKLILTERREVDNEATGKAAKKFRELHRMSQAKIARKMGFTPPYICDLEKGRRQWTPELVESYKKAVEQ